MFFSGYSPGVLNKIEHLPLNNADCDLQEVIRGLNVLFTPKKINGLLKNESWQKLNLNKGVSTEQKLVSYNNELSQLKERSERFVNFKLNKRWEGVDLKAKPLFRKMLKNFLMFEGIENASVDNAIKVFNFTASQLIAMKSALIRLSEMEAETKEIDAAILLVNDAINKLKSFRNHLVENILYRLETISEHGFVNDPMMFRISKSLSMHFEKKIDCSWTESRLEDYYKFVVKSMSYAHKLRLTNINWGFGSLVLRQDMSVMMYPHIFAKGELPISKPWLGFFFPGYLMVYNLFANPMRQINIYATFRLALGSFTNKNCVGKLKTNDLKNIKKAIQLLEVEYEYVDGEKNKLWSFFNPYAVDVCERWQAHIMQKKSELVSGAYTILMQSLTDSYRNNSPVSFTRLLNLSQILATSIDLLSQDEIINLRCQFGTLLISQAFKVLICPNSLGRDAAKGLRYVLNNSNFNSIFSDSSPKSLVNFIKASLGDVKLNYKDIIHDIENLVSEYNIDAIQSEFMADFGEQVSSNIFLLQGLLNKNYIDNKNVQLDGLQKYIVSGLKVPGGDQETVCGPIVSSIIQALGTSNDKELEKLSSGISYQYILTRELYSYPCSYKLMQNKLSFFIKSCKFNLPKIDSLVLDFAADSDKLCYGEAVFNNLLDSGYGLEGALKANYIISLESYDKELVGKLKDIVQLKFIADLEGSINSNDKKYIDKIFIDCNRSNIKLGNKAQARLDSIINQIINQSWGEISNKVILILASPEDLSRYLRNQMANVLSGYEKRDIVLNQLVDYFYDNTTWQTLGSNVFSSASVKRMLAMALDLSELSQGQLKLLDCVFSKKEFVDYHSLHEFEVIWNNKKGFWRLNQSVANAIAKMQGFVDVLSNCHKELEFVLSSVLGSEDLPPRYLNDFVAIFWSNIASIVKFGAYDEDLTKLDSYIHYIQLLIPLKSLNDSDRLRLRFLTWILDNRHYISTAQSKITRMMPIGKRSSYINALSLYLLQIGALGKDLSEKITASIAAFGMTNSESSLIHLWQSQSQYPGSDPFKLDADLAQKIDTQLEVVLDDSHLIIFEQLKSEYKFFAAEFLNGRLTFEQKPLLDLYIDNLELIKSCGDVYFQGKVSKLSKNIDYLSCSLSGHKRSANLNIHTSLFTVINLEEEKTCNNMTIKSSC